MLDFVLVFTLTRALDKGPLVASVLGTKSRIQQHVLAVFGWVLHRAAVRSLHTLPFACVSGVSAPTAVRLFQTLAARPKTRAVLGWKGGKNKNYDVKG